MIATYRLDGTMLTLAVWFRATDRQGTLDPMKQEPSGVVLTLRREPQQRGPVRTGG
jgi:hypothetical protein